MVPALALPASSTQTLVESTERVAAAAIAGAADAGGAGGTGVEVAETTKHHHVAAPPRVLTGVAFPVTTKRMTQKSGWAEDEQRPSFACRSSLRGKVR
mmetsp:Transcript_76432/g.149789  ORF Transcript_76432/g.149789 Transcript_76432/m.149789 type:complete len:98 (-) Transcript_76432:76-369(-)